MSMLHQRCDSLGTIALPQRLVHLKQVKHKTGENKTPKRTDLKGIESVNQQKKLVSTPFLDILCDFEGYNLPSSALIQQLGIKMGLGSATLIRCERYHQVMIPFKKHMFLFRTKVWFGLVVWILRKTFGFHKIKKSNHPICAKRPKFHKLPSTKTTQFLPIHFGFMVFFPAWFWEWPFHHRRF